MLPGHKKSSSNITHFVFLSLLFITTYLPKSFKMIKSLTFTVADMMGFNKVIINTKVVFHNLATLLMAQSIQHN